MRRPAAPPAHPRPDRRVSLGGPAGRHLTGFSHGAAGITYALLRLYAVTGQDELRRAALDGIAHETALFDPARANWPDLRLPDAFDRPGARAPQGSAWPAWPAPTW